MYDVVLSSFLKIEGKNAQTKISTCILITGATLVHVNKENSFGKLCVYFDKHTWRYTGKNRLVHINSKFKNQLIDLLEQLGLPARDNVEYSMNSTENDGYISFDVADSFIDAWQAIYG